MSTIGCAPHKVYDDVFARDDLFTVRKLALSSIKGRRTLSYVVKTLTSRMMTQPALRRVIDASIHMVPSDAIFEEGWFITYSHQCAGVPIHADRGYFTVNIWLMPEECMLPGANGLTFWDVTVPEDWEYHRYNASEPNPELETLCEGAAVYSVEYKFNRATVFNSRTLHKTDGVLTHRGSTYRRVNLTLIFAQKS